MARSILRVFPLFAVSFMILISFATVTAQTQKVEEDDDPITLGAENAPIKLEVFYDMQCPSCATFHPILKAALEKYPGKIHVTFRHFPLSLHDKAFLAAVSVEAANEQGKGPEMIETLLSKQKEWSASPKFNEIINRYAKELGLDVDRFVIDVNGAKTEGRIVRAVERAKQLRLTYVPYVFLNGKPISYPESIELDETISRALNSVTSAPR